MGPGLDCFKQISTIIHREHWLWMYEHLKIVLKIMRARKLRGIIIHVLVYYKVKEQTNYVLSWKVAYTRVNETNITSRNIHNCIRNQYGHYFLLHKMKLTIYASSLYRSASLEIKISFYMKIDRETSVNFPSTILCIKDMFVFQQRGIC